MNVSERPSGAFEATLFSSSRGDLRDSLSPKRKPMVGDPVKLHLATWMVSVTTSLVAMWAASFVLISSQADQAKNKVQQDLVWRLEVVEGEVKQMQIMNSQILRDAREREIKRDERASGEPGGSNGS